MHAVDQITPEIVLLLCIGGIAGILILRAIFKSKK
jgi:hypothetical protein